MWLQMAGMERLSTQSLSSLMGLVLRNAERLGIHRDGTLLGLSPVHTEERRRVWWQLQHLDLALAVRSGSTPLLMGADWDAKLPLNIEDEDIHEGMAEPPNERKGLTSMSYCRFTYWVLDQQRQFFYANKSRFALSWQSNQSLPDSSKDSLIERLEDGINKNFLQFCDPIKPLDTLLQLLARALICGMRMRTLLAVAQSGKAGHASEEHRNMLLTASMQLLEYNVAMHSHPSLGNFQWLVTGFFPWQACMSSNASTCCKKLTFLSHVRPCRDVARGRYFQSTAHLGLAIWLIHEQCKPFRAVRRSKEVACRQARGGSLESSPKQI